MAIKFDYLTCVGTTSSNSTYSSSKLETKSQKIGLLFDKSQKVTSQPDKKLTLGEASAKFTTYGTTHIPDPKAKPDNNKDRMFTIDKDPSYNPDTAVQHEDVAPYDATAQRWGVPKDVYDACAQKTNAENHKKNDTLKNIKASNGLTYPEAKYIYETLYEKYISKCKLSCPAVWDSPLEDYPGKLYGGATDDVDPSIIESKMSKEDKEMFEKAKAAIEELKQNTDVVLAYAGSKAESEDTKFNARHSGDGDALNAWIDVCQSLGIDPNQSIYR